MNLQNEDTSWIKPMKYVGIGGNACWKSTWDFAGSHTQILMNSRFSLQENRATQENTKDTLIRCQNGFDGVSSGIGMVGKIGSSGKKKF
jgi:hypothetical protein